ncbi:hypothetical protein SASPL_141463 [Salvia splendens]|uniref:Small multi-drug export protein n=1 Tax=Salvia splendens TaxID=180675 RepID=A0A8X8WQL0_SALSN|nr:uncharacterized protein LOC121766959 [Salvia splendens]KAG6399975.1 hypothetical protein SASPL_141463 [Salvia splendens]
MASLLFHSTSLSVSAASCLKYKKLLISVPRINSFTLPRAAVTKPESLMLFPSFLHPGRLKIAAVGALSDDFIGKVEKDESLWMLEEKWVKFVFWVVLFASVSLGLHALCGDARAAVADSIRGSGFGVKVAKALRASSWPDEAVVFALATLPVIELRGAIPVGYWLQLHPVFLTVLSVLGNMVPVPFIILYLKKVAAFLTTKNEAASRLLDMLLDKAKHKAAPVKEFQWIGLMLFVAVPFPGTGAWTGAFIASILDMPFWPALTANLVGVILAALVVNLLVNLGLKYAVVSAIILLVASTFIWSILRALKKSFG